MREYVSSCMVPAHVLWRLISCFLFLWLSRHVVYNSSWMWTLQRTVIVTPEIGYGKKGLNEIPVSDLAF